MAINFRNHRNLQFEQLENRLNCSSFYSDFTENPGIETSNVERFSLNNGEFITNSYTNSQEFGTIPINYKGGDFALKFDLKVLERNSGDTNVGLFSDSRKTNQSLPGDPAVYVIYGGYEQGLGLRGYDNKGNYFSSEPMKPFETNAVYHNILEYNTKRKEAVLKVSSDTDPHYFLPTEITVSIPDGLSDLTQLGISIVGNWSSSGRYQKTLIDNLYLATKNQNPIDFRDVNADGKITPFDILLVIRQLRKQTFQDNSRISAPFYDVTGDDKVNCLDLLHVINSLKKRNIFIDQVFENF